MGEKKKTTNSSWSLIAVQLDDSLPRRDPNQSHLYVSVCRGTPEERFLELQQGAGPENLVGTYHSLCQDLLQTERQFVLKRSALKACRKEKDRLARLGHAINGISTVWHTYVVDLDSTGITDVGKGYVYVGQTSHTPEERYAIHKSTKPKPPARDLRSKVVHKRGLGLNYKLMNQLVPRPPVYTKQDALALEKRWADKLHSMGYRVEAGEQTPGRHVSESKKKQPDVTGSQNDGVELDH
jgi:hypothetical protein